MIFSEIKNRYVRRSSILTYLLLEVISLLVHQLIELGPSVPGLGLFVLYVLVDESSEINFLDALFAMVIITSVQ